MKVFLNKPPRQMSVSSNKTISLQVGIILHYSSLSTLLWMAVMARVIYKEATWKAPQQQEGEAPLPAPRPMLRYRERRRTEGLLGRGPQAAWERILTRVLILGLQGKPLYSSWFFSGSRCLLKYLEIQPCCDLQDISRLKQETPGFKFLLSYSAYWVTLAPCRVKVGGTKCPPAPRPPWRKKNVT